MVLLFSFRCETAVQAVRIWFGCRGPQQSAVAGYVRFGESTVGPQARPFVQPAGGAAPKGGAPACAIEQPPSLARNKQKSSAADREVSIEFDVLSRVAEQQSSKFPHQRDQERQSLGVVAWPNLLFTYCNLRID